MSRRPPIDTILTNARITTLSTDGSTPTEATALAWRGDRITWVGDDTDVRELVDDDVRVIDAGRRRVIPGLIDAHVHLVRAGITWNDEVRWGLAGSLEEALQLIAEMAERTPVGTWIRVMGGWHPSQFAERRHPTREELDAVAPDHPVLVQFLYEWGLLNACGIERVDLEHDTVGVDPGTIERDPGGRVTGRVFTLPSLRWLFGRLPTPDFEQQVASTIAAGREFASLGITGVIDGGGANMGPDRYGAVFEAWRRRQLPLRVRLTVHSSERGQEEEELAGYLRYTHYQQGDDMLSILGLGEIISWSVHDSFARYPDLSPPERSRLYELLHACAEARWPLQMHVIRPETTDAVLGAWRAIHRDVGIGDLRWAIVHGQSIGPRHAEILQEVGAGLISEALLRLEADEVLAHWSSDQLRFAPPLPALRTAGVRVAAGSDALRVASYNPFDTLHWLTTGQSVSGQRIWDEANTLDRVTALQLLTSEAAWFSFEEEQRGRLQAGMLADLAVLTDDYLDADSANLGPIRSALTVVGGETAWTNGAIADDRARRRRPAGPGAVDVRA